MGPSFGHVNRFRFQKTSNAHASVKNITQVLSSSRGKKTFLPAPTANPKLSHTCPGPSYKLSQLKHLGVEQSLARFNLGTRVNLIFLPTKGNCRLRGSWPGIPAYNIDDIGYSDQTLTSRTRHPRQTASVYRERI